MGITYHESSGCFKLDAGSTSYVIGIMGEEQYATLEDYDVWDFELTEEEMAQMTALERDDRFADY